MMYSKYVPWLILFKIPSSTSIMECYQGSFSGKFIFILRHCSASSVEECVFTQITVPDLLLSYLYAISHDIFIIPEMWMMFFSQFQ